MLKMRDGPQMREGPHIRQSLADDGPTVGDHCRAMMKGLAIHVIEMNTMGTNRLQAVTILNEMQYADSDLFCNL